MKLGSGVEAKMADCNHIKEFTQLLTRIREVTFRGLSADEKCDLRRINKQRGNCRVCKTYLKIHAKKCDNMDN